MTIPDSPLRAGNATEARRSDILVTFVFAQGHTAKRLTKESNKFEIGQERNFWVNLSSYILSHPTSRSKIQMTREEEGGKGLARLEKKKKTAETDVCAVFY